MVYKPERKQQTFERGDSGIGKVRFSTDGKKVQVKLNVPAGKDRFEEKTYVLDVENCPDNILQAKNASEWACQMSSANDWEKDDNLNAFVGGKLMSFRPVRGAFVVTTKNFAAKEGEEPAPKSKEVDFVKDGKHIKYSYDYFTVILEIVEPEGVKGLNVPLVLHYNFSEKTFEGKGILQFSMGGKYTDALEEYMLVSGMLEDKYWPIEYKDNVLPTLQRIALHEGRKFQATMKDGWIVLGSLIPFDEPVQEEIPFDEVETQFPPLSSNDEKPPFDENDDSEMDFEPDFE